MTGLAKFKKGILSLVALVFSFIMTNLALGGNLNQHAAQEGGVL